ncbi:MAG: ceramidase domain-containing protein [Bdellovibrionales bacterium]|nr:ceramidase domain-containing protein [Bdellovibrionales bacterium]
MISAALHPLPAGCPWSDWARPTLAFCEASLCSWITAPANTVSNLAFVIWGIWVYRDSKKNSAPGDFLRSVGPILMLIGLLSGFYHASYTWVGQVGDLGSMFLIAALFVAMNLKRLGWIRSDQVLPVYWATTGVALILLLIFPTLGIFEFALICIFGITLEFGFLRKKQKPNYRYLTYALLTWAVAQTVWILDITRVWCDPDRHWFQWHAVWHLGTATAGGLVYLFYRQFGAKR